MLQNAYFVAKIGADTAENEQHFAEMLLVFVGACRHSWALALGGVALEERAQGTSPTGTRTVVAKGGGENQHQAAQESRTYQIGH